MDKEEFVVGERCHPLLIQTAVMQHLKHRTYGQHLGLTSGYVGGWCSLPRQERRREWIAFHPVHPSAECRNATPEPRPRSRKDFLLRRKFIYTMGASDD